MVETAGGSAAPANDAKPARSVRAASRRNPMRIFAIPDLPCTQRPRDTGAGLVSLIRTHRPEVPARFRQRGRPARKPPATTAKVLPVRLSRGPRTDLDSLTDPVRR